MADVDPKLGELIKKTRLERRLTQEEVAEMIGCHSQYYTQRHTIMHALTGWRTPSGKV